MRRIRKLVNTGLPVAGTLLVLAAVLLVIDLRTQIALVIAGLLMVEVGVWKLANPLLPNERRFHALRTEVDRFIVLVRNLNDAALRVKVEGGAAVSSLEEARSALHTAVERMTAVAGKTDDELAGESASVGRADRAPAR